jgi:hypothetical protein
MQLLVPWIIIVNDFKTADGGTLHHVPNSNPYHHHTHLSAFESRGISLTDNDIGKRVMLLRVKGSWKAAWHELRQSLISQAHFPSQHA